MKKRTSNKQKKTIPGLKRRRLSPDVRRAELLEAALCVLRRRGPMNARVEDVTEAAGVAKGTFYLYFPSWDDLLVEIRAHLCSTYVSEMQDIFAVEALSDWWAAFEKECVHFVDFVEELGSELHMVIFHGSIADRPPDLTMFYEKTWADMLKKGIESGSCRNVSVDIAAQLIFSVLHKTAENILQTGDRDRNFNTMFDLLRAWLCTSGPVVADQKNFPQQRRRGN